jgi:transcriptional regulator with XRE-family HTH domain
MGVSENIIRLRKLTGVTQEELGRIAGVSRSAVSLWEIGDSAPRMGAVQSIADHYHLRKANIIEDGGMDNVAVSATGKLFEMRTDDMITDSEREILALYRSCNDVGRDYFMQMAQVTAGIYRNK